MKDKARSKNNTNSINFDDWEAVIGLEVHIQLNTATKLFSGAINSYGAEPNTQTCPIDIALPGVLPTLNKEAVKMAVLFGFSINAKITEKSLFVRKNYFYPDLPKGYQISQHQYPIIKGGYIPIYSDDGLAKHIGITSANLEEDTGKSLHEDFHDMTGIDLNRAGAPLIEVVSNPELSSAKEAVAYLKMLHNLIRYLDISNANMQEGSFRCDANVSIRKKGDKKLGTRAEIKNVNSFRFVEKAINYEIKRQIEILAGGGTIFQETRAYDDAKDCTLTLRRKEQAQDYRFFGDPDLMPLIVTPEFQKRVKKTLPELPWEKLERLCAKYGISHYDASILCSDIDLAAYYEETLSFLSKSAAKLTANWVLGELLAFAKKHNSAIKQVNIAPQQLAELIARILDETISGKIAKEIFGFMWDDHKSVDTIIEEKNLKQITNTNILNKFIDQVFAAFPEQLQEYRAGKEKLFGFFAGKVMAASKGKANPAKLEQLLKNRLTIL